MKMKKLIVMLACSAAAVAFAAEDGKTANGDDLTAAAIEAFKADKWATGFDLAQKADKTNAEVQLYLGECYEKGEVVRQDLWEASRRYRKAAEQGIPMKSRRV